MPPEIKLLKAPQLQSSIVEGQPPAYTRPAPVYDPICGELSRRAGVANNLMTSFVCMERSGGSTFGDVWSLEEVMECVSV